MLSTHKKRSLMTLSLQVGHQKTRLVDTSKGASMKDCAFRAHDDRFWDIIGKSPQIVRLAQKDYEFAHEVSMTLRH